jgi:hypothetical protein
VAHVGRLDDERPAPPAGPATDGEGCADDDPDDGAPWAVTRATVAASTRWSPTTPESSHTTTTVTTPLM